MYFPIFLCVLVRFPFLTFSPLPKFNTHQLLTKRCICSILGHYLDQKRLKQGLYRHPWDDISYVLPEHMSM